MIRNPDVFENIYWYNWYFTLFTYKKNYEIVYWEFSSDDFGTKLSSKRGWSLTHDFSMVKFNAYIWTYKSNGPMAFKR